MGEPGDARLTDDPGAMKRSTQRADVERGAEVGRAGRLRRRRASAAGTFPLPRGPAGVARSSASLAPLALLVPLAALAALTALTALTPMLGCRSGAAESRVAPVASERVRPRSQRAPGARRLFASLGRTCFLGDDSTVCWGVDPRSDLRAPIVRERPTTIGALRGASLLSFAARAGCAAFEDGAVECWHAHGEAEMIGIAGVRDVRCLAAGSARMSACTGDGEVVSWAFDPGWASRPEPVPDLRGVVDLVAGDAWYGGTACALHGDGDVHCWKWDVTGGSTPFWTGHSREPLRAKALADASHGWSYGALDRDGAVRTFDASLDALGALPGAFPDARALLHDRCWRVVEPRGAVVALDCDEADASADEWRHATDPLRDVEEAASGPDHGCARTRAGEIWCWGDNQLGQLGDGTRAPRASAVRVARAW